MLRIVVSLIAALLVGAGVGLYLGWVVFPAQAAVSPAAALATTYQDEYTVMVAAAWLVDRDTTAALDRLRLLAVPNIPAYVQDVTERYITKSRSIEDIRLLVALSEGLGRLTPIMEPYRLVTAP